MPRWEKKVSSTACSTGTGAPSGIDSPIPPGASAATATSGSGARPREHVTGGAGRGRLGSRDRLGLAPLEGGAAEPRESVGPARSRCAFPYASCCRPRASARPPCVSCWKRKAKPPFLRNCSFDFLSVKKVLNLKVFLRSLFPPL